MAKRDPRLTFSPPFVTIQDNFESFSLQSNKMAVTTSVFPNLNTFSLGPEFCVLHRKLKSTCSTYKRVTLTERYPGTDALTVLLHLDIKQDL